MNIVKFTRYTQRAKDNQRFERLLQACCQTTLNYTRKLLSRALDKLDDQLFAYSEKAIDNNTQSKYFEAMKALRIERKDFERHFYQGVFKGFENFFNGIEQTQTSAKPEIGQLALIDENAFEEALAVENIETRVNTLYSEEMYLLNLRMAVLNSGHKLGEQNPALPTSPSHICLLLKTGLKKLELDVDVKIVFCKIFDKMVMGEMKALYDAINRHLQKAGVLPNLRYSTAKQPAPKPNAPAQIATNQTAANPAAVNQTATHQTYAPTQAPDNTHQSHNIQQFKTILSQLAARKDVPPEIPTAQAVQPPVLLNALSNIQQSISNQASDVRLALQETTRLNERLDKEIRQMQQGDQQTQIDRESTDTIDLVGMLFNAMLQDESLPAIVKALLSNLQTPYIKIALKDKGLFTFDYHPARRLLNKLVEGGCRFVSENEGDRGVFQQMEIVVRTVLEKYVNNVALFDYLLADFEKFLLHFATRMKHLEKRAVETEKGKEKMGQARTRASQAIREKTKGQFLPKPFQKLLSDPWHQLLVLIALSGDNRDIKWADAVHAIDELAWSATPKITDEEREAHNAMVVPLMIFLQRGLRLVGYLENDIETLLQQIEHIQTQAYSADLDNELVTQLSHEPEPEPEPEPEKIDETAALIKAPPQDIEQTIQMLKAFEYDSLFEFEEEQHKFKFVWYSTASHKFMFVDQYNIKVKMINEKVFAQAWLDKQARHITAHPKPFVDSALGKIEQTLSVNHP